MKRISALTVLKAIQQPESKIGVYCKDPNSVQRETIPFLVCEKAVLRNLKHEIHLDNGSIIRFFYVEDDQSGRLRGYRFNILLVEGKKREINKDLLLKTLVPMMSVCFDPVLVQALRDEVDFPEKWIRKPEIIFSDD